MCVHNSPTTIADTVIAMVIASKVKHAHFRLPQQFAIISNHCAVLCTQDLSSNRTLAVTLIYTVAVSSHACKAPFLSWPCMVPSK